jgi:hypothetical protein
MKILFDQGTPLPLRAELRGHDVSTAAELGWENLSNGKLLEAAEIRFDLFITTDQSLHYQQNLVGRKLAILVLMTTSWPKIKLRVRSVIESVESIQPGEYREIVF